MCGGGRGVGGGNGVVVVKSNFSSGVKSSAKAKFRY